MNETPVAAPRARAGLLPVQFASYNERMVVRSRRPLSMVVALGLMLGPTSLAGAQQPPPASPPPASPPAASPPTAASIAAAGERWLTSDQSSLELRDATAAVLLEGAELGLDWLARQLATAAQASTSPRAKGVNGLALQFVLGYLEKEQQRGFVYVGQYAPLRRLQPFAGDLLFGLLLETPDWYPHTFRTRLVPALRDLQPGPPSVARLDAVLAIADDDREPQDLHRALAAMLWQWGKQAHARAIVDALQRATAEGDAEERVRIELELAGVWTSLRAYDHAATAFRAAENLAAGANITLRPVVHYAAACVVALRGDVEQGMAELERCARMLASPDLDASLRVEKQLFEHDPELDLLRRQPGFPALLRLAFGPEQSAQREAESKDGRGPGR